MPIIDPILRRGNVESTPLHRGTQSGMMACASLTCLLLQRSRKVHQQYLTRCLYHPTNSCHEVCSDGVRAKSYWCRNPRTRFNSHVVSRMNADLALLEKRPVGGSYLQATFTSDRLHAVLQYFRRNECHLRASWSCIATLRSQLSLSRSPPSRCSAFEGSKVDVERF